MNEEVIYGIHAVAALLNNEKRKITHIYLQADRQDKRMSTIQEQAFKRQIPMTKLDRKQLSERFSEQHQGVVAIAQKAREYNEKDLLVLLETSSTPWFILILDGVTDPHNLGACLRTAEASGVDLVIVPKDKNASMTPTVSKVACGAAELVPVVRVTNLARTMKALQQQGVWIYGAAGEATESLYEFDLTTSAALVMGAEGKGMRRLTRETCDNIFSIPMLGQVESLNVSVATGVCLYEVVRQRQR